ncbi:alpha/beta fold hydrolase [Hydrocarboniclastica marina]|uniref:Alpha/beta fold hydrolase n=1 Tax=Hydrocarboniclastica marina TaxID=2259620 RepID=A0A4P7XEG7_9ALTE|nr:alpha/beta fold hydrolase [Hydrocarboniclastica marina]MAL99770.1 alpha/beta hydrolase [Alteromonadaceae bacterium]QCF25256.1 alpha/beta fold hydrolase [Hydrocarboniclastica marina]
MESTARAKPSLTEKAFWTMINAVERRLFSDRFIVSNKTPYDIIYQDGIMSVRHYLPLEEDEIQVGDTMVPVEPVRQRVPVVLVPPLAATAMIFDLLPQRSLVRYFLARGFDVYLIDWGEVEAEHHGLSLESYVLDWMPAALKAVRDDSGVKDISFFAYCMGGLLALMYTAVSQDRHVRNMVTVASPVDMHQVGIAGRVLSLVYRPAQIVSQLLNISLLDLPARFVHVPGWFNSFVFKLTNPIGSVISSLELLVNLWDREYVKEHTTVSQWFNKMVDYPGETIKGMVVHMGLNNRMARGRMRLGDQEAEFKQIRCSILAFAGEGDKLVSVRSAHKVLDIVSSEDKEFCVVPGGHAGVFAGSHAPDNTWAMGADWLLSRSS